MLSTVDLQRKSDLDIGRVKCPSWQVRVGGVSDR